MSFFNHSSTPRKLSDNVARFRYTEVPVEGGSSSLTQGNQIKFRFSSNQDSWHAPSLSYILYELETLHDGAAIEAADNVVFNTNVGASLSNGGPSSINLNGVDIAVAQSPAVTSEMYNRMFMEKSVRNTIGEPFLSGRESGNLLQVAYQIPCGLVLGNDKAIPGGQWVYSVNLSNNFIRDCIVSDGASVGRTTNEFQFASTDGLGILEFYFGDVAIAANDQIMKIVTVDYKSFKNTGSWGDMLFRTNASNQFCGVFNSGSNDVIKVFDNGWLNGEKVFLHDTTVYNVNPTGYGDSSGGGPGGTPIAQLQNKLPQVRAASGILHSWNSANANHSPSNGFLSLHYVSKGDSAIGFTNTDAEIVNTSFGGLTHFGTYKTGPEILNGGKLSIATGSHIMIKINENTIEYYLNGSIVSSETQTGSNGNRIGGITNFRRFLTLGGPSNTGSFTLKKFKWHGNKKDATDAALIYAERDFSVSGSAFSQVDLTPYVNNASINNLLSPPQLVLQAAAGNITCLLRDSYIKSETYSKTEADAFRVRARGTVIRDHGAVGFTYTNGTANVDIYDLTGISPSVTNGYNVSSSLTSIPSSDVYGFPILNWQGGGRNIARYRYEITFATALPNDNYQIFLQENQYTLNLFDPSVPVGTNTTLLGSGTSDGAGILNISVRYKYTSKFEVQVIVDNEHYQQPLTTGTSVDNVIPVQTGFSFDFMVV